MAPTVVADPWPTHTPACKLCSFLFPASNPVSLPVLHGCGPRRWCRVVPQVPLQPGMGGAEGASEPSTTPIIKVRKPCRACAWRCWGREAGAGFRGARHRHPATESPGRPGPPPHPPPSPSPRSRGLSAGQGTGTGRDPVKVRGRGGAGRPRPRPCRRRRASGRAGPRRAGRHRGSGGVMRGRGAARFWPGPKLQLLLPLFLLVPRARPLGEWRAGSRPALSAAALAAERPVSRARRPEGRGPAGEAGERAAARWEGSAARGWERPGV